MYQVHIVQSRIKSWSLGSIIKCITVFLAQSNDYNLTSSPDTLHSSLTRVFWTSVTVRVDIFGLTHYIHSYHRYVIHSMTPYFPTRSSSGTSSAYCSDDTIETLTSPGSRNGGDYITSYTCPLIHNPGWAFKAKIRAFPSFLSMEDDVFST
jgi:hypothetical protein